MYKNLSLAALGHSVTFDVACALATRHNFAGVELDLQFLHSLGSSSTAATWFAETGLRPGGFSLNAAWRETDTEEAFTATLATVATDAELAGALGCKRCFTTVPPSSKTRDFYQHFDIVVPRLISVANILATNGIMLGFEFLGPEFLPPLGHKDFVHTLDGARTFAASIGMHSLNTGVVLDSFHWHSSGSTLREIEHLDHNEVVYMYTNETNTSTSTNTGSEDTSAEVSAELLSTLKAIGYLGPITVKSRNSTPARSPEESAFAASATLDRLLD